MSSPKFLKLFRHPAVNLLSDPVVDFMIPRGRRHAWLTAAPKSGSTWLNEILTHLLERPSLFLVPGYGRREHEIEMHRLLLGPRKKAVYSPSLHTRFNEETLRVIRRGNIKVVVQVRNIFDTVVSFRDHLNSAFQDHDGRKPIEWSMAYVDEKSWDRLSEEQQTGFVIDLVLPWFFNFYCGWYRSGLFEDGTAILSTYNDLRSDPPGHVRRVSDFLGENFTDEQILAAIEKTKKENTRKNKGLSGRGQTLLTESERDRIAAFANYYPGIDFSPLGIDAPAPPTQ